MHAEVYFYLFLCSLDPVSVKYKEVVVFLFPVSYIVAQYT